MSRQPSSTSGLMMTRSTASSTVSASWSWTSSGSVKPGRSTRTSPTASSPARDLGLDKRTESSSGPLAAAQAQARGGAGAAGAQSLRPARVRRGDLVAARRAADSTAATTKRAFGKPPLRGARAARRDASAMRDASASMPTTSVPGSRAAIARTKRPSPVPRSITVRAWRAASSASYPTSTWKRRRPTTLRIG
jgi:hypothetical protein